jgi:lipopolysaccharide transport system permease protein
VIPLASVLSGAVDVALSLVVLVGMMGYYGFVPSANIVFLPLFVLLAMMAALAVGFWLSALNVEFRDVRYTVPFLTQLWLFVTPIAYPSSLLSEPWRTLYGLNPMAGVVEGFRWSLLQTGGRPGGMIVVSSIATVALLTGGAFYFRRMERTFADVI